LTQVEEIVEVPVDLELVRVTCNMLTPLTPLSDSQPQVEEMVEVPVVLELASHHTHSFDHQ
jgi:hypothetical protein